VLFSAILAYAIVAHHLMDIKLVLRRSFAYLAPLITVLAIYTTIEYMVSIYLPSWVDTANVVVLVCQF